MTSRPCGARAAPVRPDLATLYKHYAPYAYACARRLGVRPDAAEDVVQDVFVVACRRLEDFEMRSSVKTWLFAILLRVVARHRRGRHERLRPSCDPDVLAGPTDNPERLVSRAQAHALCRSLLRQLRDERRTVFLMAEVEQRTMPEICRLTGMKLNCAYSRLRYARRDLKRAAARTHSAQLRQA